MDELGPQGWFGCFLGPGRQEKHAGPERAEVPTWRPPPAPWCPPSSPSPCPSGSPAAVLPLHVQRRLSPSEAQAGEGVIQGERHIAQAVGAVRLIVHILPVGAEARGARRVVSVQVVVQLPDDLLIDHSFEFSGKEGGPGCLLCSGGGWIKRAMSASREGGGGGRGGGEGCLGAGLCSQAAWIQMTLAHLSALSFLICNVELKRSASGLSELTSRAFKAVVRTESASFKCALNKLHPRCL